MRSKKLRNILLKLLLCLSYVWRLVWCVIIIMLPFLIIYVVVNKMWV